MLILHLSKWTQFQTSAQWRMYGSSTAIYRVVTVTFEISTSRRSPGLWVLASTDISPIHQILSIFTSCQNYCKKSLTKRLSPVNPFPKATNISIYCWLVDFLSIFFPAEPFKQNNRFEVTGLTKGLRWQNPLPPSTRAASRWNGFLPQGPRSGPEADA